MKLQTLKQQLQDKIADYTLPEVLDRMCELVYENYKQDSLSIEIVKLLEEATELSLRLQYERERIQSVLSLTKRD